MSELVYCDVSQVVPPLYESAALCVIKGSSSQQVSFATRVRTKKLMEWMPDLPISIFNALHALADAEWWLANKDKSSEDIGWPESWVISLRNLTQPELGQPSSLMESRKKALKSAPNTWERPQKPKEKGAAGEEFELFARKVCHSPELAYLTIMSLAYRNTKDPVIGAKLKEARERVQGHLDAIDNIGSE